MKRKKMVSTSVISYHAPAPLDECVSNLKNEWDLFKRAFKIYLIATELGTEDQLWKVNLSLNLISDEDLKISPRCK